MRTYLDAETPADIISMRRQELGMTQAELSNKMGFARANFISIVEAGRSKIPIERAIDFADALKMDRVWLIEQLLRDRFPAVAEELFDRHRIIEIDQAA
ncbi:MAG: helix-turn-helix domain-containing protein [Alphaproteobacteria bacterium]|nr:helix-turn-helix domain-containing protein [Alphaproteobacteria bacterium]